MLNERRRWFHSSRVKLPQVRMSELVFLLMEWSLVPHKSAWLSLPCLAVFFVERNTSITMCQRSRVGRPSMRNPASKEMISDSVELCETNVCFLHIQLMGTNVLLPKIHKILPEVDFESSRSPAKSESWSKLRRQCWAVLPTWQYCRNSLVWWMCEINLANRLSHVWVHFVTALASLFADHSISGLPIRAKYKHLKMIFVSKLVIILQLIQFLLVWTDDHPSNDMKLCITAPLSCLRIHSIVQRIFEHALPCRKTMRLFLREAFRTLVTFQLLKQKYMIQTSLCSSIIISFGLHSHWVHPQVYVIKKWSWFVEINVFFHYFFHMGAIFCIFPVILCHPRTPLEKFLFSMNKQTFNIWYFFPSKFRQNFLELSFAQSSKWVSVQISFKKNHWIFNTCPWFGLFMSWKTYPYVWKFWLGFWAFWERPLILLECMVIWRAAVFRDAEKPCSVKTASGPESSFTMSPLSTTLPL